MDAMQLAIMNGYYFDTCIDLLLCDGDGRMVCKLTTPSRGVKPDITVKGNLIPNNTAVSSTITIKNLSYAVAIDDVESIFCKMYYAGLQGELPSKMLSSGSAGHWIEYSVIYATQEGEPPNRAVCFHCEVAASDFAHTHKPLVLMEEGFKPAVSDEEVNNEVKSSSFINFLIKVAKAHNKNEDLGNVGFVGTDISPQGREIKKIVVHGVKFKADDGKELEVAVSDKGLNTIQYISRAQNAFTMLMDDRTIPFYLTMFVSGLNYENALYCESLVHYDKSHVNDNFKKFFDDDYIAVFDLNGLEQKVTETAVNQEMESTAELKATKVPTGDTPDSPIPLNFVKGAYKNQAFITVQTIFDDRLFPMCWCKISSTLLMGRSGLGSGKTIEKGKNIIFQITGGLEFSFSTITGGSMSFSASQETSMFVNGE